MGLYIMKKIISLFIVVALIAAAVITFQKSPVNNIPDHQDSLYFSGGGKDADQLDPHLSTKSHDKVLFSMMFNGLVRFKPGSMDPKDIEPDLALSWESSNDGLVWTFFLRKGVQFHKGYGELTAADVVGSLNRAADAGFSAISSDYNSFEKVEAVDPYTVKITLKSAIQT